MPERMLKVVKKSQLMFQVNKKFRKELCSPVLRGELFQDYDKKILHSYSRLQSEQL